MAQIVLLAAGCLAQSLASAATIPTTASFSVGAVIQRGCMVTGSPGQTTGIALGSLDFGTHSALRTGTVSSMASAGTGGQALVQCTPGTTLQVKVDAGLHASGGTRRLSNGVSFVPYTLTLVSGSGTLLAPNVAVGMAMGSTPTALPVMGSITFPGAGLSSGIYTDTLQVTLSW